MSMELLNQFMNDAVDFTFTAIVLALTLFALAAIWKETAKAYPANHDAP